MNRFETSSLMFLKPGCSGTIEGRPIESQLKLRDIEILEFFMEPNTVATGLDAGFENEDIDRLIELGLLANSVDSVSGAPGALWETYNWQRAALLMYDTGNWQATSSHSDLFQEHRVNLGAGSDDAATEVMEKLLDRRTVRFFSEGFVEGRKWQTIMSELRDYIKDKRWLSVYIAAQAIEGLDAGIYKLDVETGEHLRHRQELRRKDLLDCLHGQWWLNGSGACLFFVVLFEELRHPSPGTPTNYVDLFVQLGAAGQALIESVARHELGTWMTPALSESLAANLLGLDEAREEALYFFKVGEPATAPSDERRSPI